MTTSHDQQMLLARSDRPAGTSGSAWGLGAEPARQWMTQAACANVDPEQFFPEKGGTPRGAKIVCDDCPVRAACLNYALVNDERFGVWGGLTETERRTVTPIWERHLRTVHCSVCDTKFQTIIPNKAYCSGRCRNAAYERRRRPE